MSWSPSPPDPFVPGDELFTGGNGPDSAAGLDGADTLLGSGGADTLDDGFNLDTVVFTGASGAVVVDLGTQTVSGPGAGGVVISSIAAVVGSAFDDRVTGNDLGQVLDGGDGARRHPGTLRRHRGATGWRGRDPGRLRWAGGRWLPVRLTKVAGRVRRASKLLRSLGRRTLVGGYVNRAMLALPNVGCHIDNAPSTVVAIICVDAQAIGRSGGSRLTRLLRFEIGADSVMPYAARRIRAVLVRSGPTDRADIIS